MLSVGYCISILCNMPHSGALLTISTSSSSLPSFSPPSTAYLEYSPATLYCLIPNQGTRCEYCCNLITANVSLDDKPSLRMAVDRHIYNTGIQVDNANCQAWSGP